MSIFAVIFYGILQGLSEFLPISSSGHLALIQDLFSGASANANYFTFDVFLHFGTLIAVFIVFWRDIAAMVVAVFTIIYKLVSGRFRWATCNQGERMALLVIIATIPMAAAIPLNSKVEQLSGYYQLIAILLMINGVILYVSDRISRMPSRKKKKDAMSAKPSNALFVGVVQLIAIIPGISRSGSTITGGLLAGFDRRFAVKFSFIMSIPAILGANAMQLIHVLRGTAGGETLSVPMYLLGAACAMLAGVGAIKLLQYITERSSFKGFAIYCVALGIVALLFGPQIANFLGTRF